MARVLALVSLVCAVGCAASERQGQSENAISPAAAAEQSGETTALLLSKFPATDRAKRELEIVDWTVYKIDGYFGSSYLLAYATDSAGDVKFGITVDKGTDEGSIAQFNKDGVDPSAGEPSATTGAILAEELRAISEKLVQESGKTCAEVTTAFLFDSFAVALTAMVGVVGVGIWALGSWGSTGVLSFVLAPLVLGPTYVLTLTIRDAAQSWREGGVLCGK